jgi:hypothetical protein
MRSRLLTAGALAVMLATTTPLLVRAQTGGTPAPTAPPAGKSAHPRKEKHPEMMHALKALERAKGFLQNGAHDFGGHRAKAQQLTEQAIQEIHAGLAYDKS